MENSEKPSEAHRKELLSKLESIIKILNDRVEGENDIPILRETIHESMLLNDEHVSVGSSEIPSKSDTLPVAAADQQLPSEEEMTQNEAPADVTGSPINAEKNVSTKTENPFLPQHIRARLYTEDSSDGSLSNSASENENSVDSPKHLHDSIIDNLIAFYLPKIEADLRRRLKALAAKENHNHSIHKP